MNKPLLQSLCAAILILTFTVGLPMQGTAMASPVPWAGDAETLTPDGCDDCGLPPAMSMLCPTVFCVGLTGIILETPTFGRLPPNSRLRPMPTASVGLSLTPDPHPPRLFI